LNSAFQQSEIQTLLSRADECARDGDVRAAVSFYQAALKGARASGVDIAGTADLRRAQHYVETRARDFELALDHALDGLHVDNGPLTRRLTHALDLLKGKRAIYPQRPSQFYYPYLAARQFFEGHEFPWAPELEAAAPSILAELLSLLEDGAEFNPYVEDIVDRPRRDFHGLNNDSRWTAFYLWKHGTLLRESAAQCPVTSGALTKVPLSNIGARTPTVFFSRLEPGAHIPPHTGMLNCRLICHLPLIVPPGCWLRVGNERRELKEGELLIFDDSIEHEASNPSDQQRIVLIFDIWRPELTDFERKGISAIFDAIDGFG
jgi:hypothetical protein